MCNILCKCLKEITRRSGGQTFWCNAQTAHEYVYTTRMPRQKCDMLMNFHAHVKMQMKITLVAVSFLFYGNSLYERNPSFDVDVENKKLTRRQG